MHGKVAREEAETVIAADAVPVIEVDDLIAIVAGKEFHRFDLCKAGADEKCPPRACTAGMVHPG
ncbi:hypothetical protein GGE45_004296 [Rhizobium aethiopicum]|uniref:Uncharacterized protein n=1 Tax=Rhizobium aethiopicum TaxID=1138170 RepID=A0A7W6QAI6_9HYPH|nr:hypothetical protein [Rhizobium aethiopicum]MBB4581943.1 hypothetical protein [Rhizobium aethiopicum]